MPESHLAAKLRSIILGEVKEKEPMEFHTTFRIGGPADLFVVPRNLEDIRGVLGFARQEGLPIFILGNGSNLLVKDEGIRGIVLLIGPGLDFIRLSGTSIRAGAGALLPKVVRLSMEHSLSGLEFAAGIPGTVGGAVVMNAGANGGDMSQVVKSISVLDFDGRVITLSAQDAGFAYRTSGILRHGILVTEAELELAPGNGMEIQARINEVLKRRRKTQPSGYPNAGSIFKNPPNIPAGYLIEQAGGKGLRVGKAEVSQVHANFIVNLGGATARDVLELMDKVQRLVNLRFGIILEPEIKVIG